MSCYLKFFFFFFLPDILKSVESKPNLITCSLDYFSNNLTGPSVATATSPEDRLKSLCYHILGWTSPWVLVLGQGCSCQGPTSISVCVAHFLSCSLCFSYSGFTVVTFRNGIPSSTASLSGGQWALPVLLFCKIPFTCPYLWPRSWYTVLGWVLVTLHWTCWLKACGWLLVYPSAEFWASWSGVRPKCWRFFQILWMIRMAKFVNL